jgi:hypothetical protein
LIGHLGRLPNPVINIGGLEYLQDCQQCRLVQGHRVLVSFRENHWRSLADHHTAARPARSGTPSQPITYTTRGDAAVESNGQAFDRGRLGDSVRLHISRLRLRINCALTCL